MNGVTLLEVEVEDLRKYLSLIGRRSTCSRDNVGPRNVVWGLAAVEKSRFLLGQIEGGKEVTRNSPLNHVIAIRS